MNICKINLNETVKFKLTDHGKDIYYHQYDELNERIKKRGGKPLEPRMPRVDKDGYTEMQLWCFIELYGNHIGMARPNVIEPLEILYTDSYKKDNGWISVEDRLPEKDGKYLVYDLGQHRGVSTEEIRITYFKRGDKYYDYMWKTHFSHWMPLPEAPKIEGGSNDT